MVLADDNFATIVDAVRRARRLSQHPKVHLLPLVGERRAGRRLQRVVHRRSHAAHAACDPLRINLVTNGLPALALGVDPPDPSQMLEPPRPAGFSARVHTSASQSWGCGWGRGTAGADRGRFKTLSIGYARAIAFAARALAAISRVQLPLAHDLLLQAAAVPLDSAPARRRRERGHTSSRSSPSLRPVFRTFAMSPYQWGGHARAVGVDHPSRGTFQTFAASTDRRARSRADVGAGEGSVRRRSTSSNAAT